MTKIKIDRDMLIWIVIAILALVVLYVTFFPGAATSPSASAATSAGQTAQASYGGMVGGC